MSDPLHAMTESSPSYRRSWLTTHSQDRHGPLITRKDAAAMLAVSPRTVSNLAKAGYFRTVRIGKSVRFDAADIILFIGIAKGYDNE